MFSTRKRCLIGILIRGYPNFYSLPPKIGFWAQKGQIWPKTGIFGQIWAFLAHLIRCPTKKQLCGYQIVYLLPLKIGLLAHKRPNWPILAHLVPWLTKKRRKLGVFSAGCISQDTYLLYILADTRGVSNNSAN